MRGRAAEQPEFINVVNADARIPTDHPIRRIKKFCDEALRGLSPLFDELYSQEGRPSIPPEQLLKARVRMALYSVRSERLFAEQLQWNILWMWFLDRELDEGSWDHSVLSKNAGRVLARECAQFGGLRKTQYRGTDRVGAWGYFVGAACNLVLMARLALGTMRAS